MELRQLIEESRLNEVLSREGSEADAGLTELLSVDNKTKAASYFYQKFQLNNNELKTIQKCVSDYLLEHIVVRQNSIIPRRIAEPTEKDIEFITLCSALIKLDKSLADYRRIEKENQAEQNRIRTKKTLAEKRIATLNEKISQTSELLNSDITLHERTKLEADKKRFEDEIEQTKPKLDEIEEKIKNDNNKRPDSYNVSADYGAVLCAAKDIGLDGLISLEIEPAECTSPITDTELMYEFNDVSIIFEAFKRPVAEKQSNISRKIISHALTAVITSALTFGIALWATKNNKPEKEPPKNDLEFVLRTEPDKMPGQKKTINVPEQVEVPVKVFVIHPENKRYIPGKTELKSFNPETKDIIFEYTGTSWSAYEIIKKVPVTNEQLMKSYVKVVTLGYEKREDGLWETRKQYLLGTDVPFEFISKEEKKVTEEEIMAYLKDYAKQYKSVELAEAMINVKGKMIISGEYESRGNLVVLKTTHAGSNILVDLGEHVPKEFDGLPDFGISCLGETYYCDVDRVYGVKWIKPPEGKEVDILQLTHPIRKQFPIQNVDKTKW